MRVRILLPKQDLLRPIHIDLKFFDRRNIMKKIFGSLEPGGEEVSDLVVPPIRRETSNGAPKVSSDSSGSAAEVVVSESVGVGPTLVRPLVIDIGAEHSNGLAGAKPKEAERIAVPALDAVPHVTCAIRPESRIVLPSSGEAPMLERFRVLEHRLNHLRRERPFRRVLVTSAAPKEGKTFLSVNLAITLARSSARVLLIDADMRRPAVDAMLGLKPEAGLADILSNKRSFAECLRTVDPLKLFYISAGEANSDAGELLNTERARDVFQHASELFDWVIVDSCPMLPFSDVHLLAAMTDAVLMVTRAEVTNRTDLKEALTALTPYRMLGVVLNASGDAREKAYYHPYYKNK